MATPAKPGDAWIWDANFNNGKGKAKGKWVQPPKPSANATWNDTVGWKTKEAAASEYGFALSVINSDSDLTRIFNEAWQAFSTGQEWSPSKFINAIQSSSWYMTRTEQQRLYYKIKNDPTQAVELQAKIDANKATLRSVASTIGANLTEAELSTLAEENLINGWNAEQIKTNLVNYVKYSADPISGFGSLVGEAGNVEDKIRSFAKNMGVEVDNAWVLDNTQKAISAGNNTQIAEDFIRERAKEKYAAYANELDTSTVADLSYNYRASMANTLELGLEEISMNDSLIKQAMAIGDGKGGKKNLFQFEQELRQDPRWAKTKNAKESSSVIVNDVLSTFGLI
jgi:hypothetical protein